MCRSNMFFFKIMLLPISLLSNPDGIESLEKVESKKKKLKEILIVLREKILPSNISTI